MKAIIASSLVIFGVIFIIYALVLGLGFQPNVILFHLSWGWSLAIGVGLLVIYQFGFEDPIW